LDGRIGVPELDERELVLQDLCDRGALPSPSNRRQWKPQPLPWYPRSRSSSGGAALAAVTRLSQCARLLGRQQCENPG